MRKSIMIAGLIIITACFNEESESFKFEVNTAVSGQSKTIRLKKKWAYQKMIATKNTLNDTCKIGLMIIPPGKTGVLYQVEFFQDSITYSYIPYRASKGTLIIEHRFYDY